MRKKTLFSTVVCLASWLAPSATLLADFTPLVGFDKQLFPSFIIAMASLRQDETAVEEGRIGDPLGILGVEVLSPADNASITVTVEAADYLEPSTITGTLPKAGATYRVFPKIKYRYKALAQCSQAAPASMTFRVKIGDSAAEEQTVTCTVRTVNDCPFALVNGENVVDASITFAAYVNEQHPFVDKLLREALDIGIVEGFDGYQSGEANVVLQAYALWDLLVARDIRYSNITTTAVDSQTVACQHVRMIEDSINNGQANCVDGSVLWASLMQKIGINAFLVMEETHCYAGFYADSERKSFYTIETTLLGTEIDVAELTIPEDIDQAIAEELRNDASFASFVAALQVGFNRLHESQQRESNGGEVEHQLIDVAQARQQGILPIAFQNREEFVGYDFTDLGEEELADEETEWSEDEENADEEYADEEDEESEEEYDSEWEDEEYYEEEDEDQVEEYDEEEEYEEE